MSRFTSFTLLLTVLAGACSTAERSLIFTTHTNVGVDVSIGAASDSPVNLTLGYERFEGVMNPVYDEDGIDATGAKYRADAYSVIAKFEGTIQSGAKTAGTANSTTGPEASGAVVATQWFATGRAAELLAGEKLTAAALSDNPTMVRALAATIGSNANDPHDTATAAALLSIASNAVSGLRAQAASGDLDATIVLAELDKAAKTIPAAINVDRYTWDAVSSALTARALTSTSFANADELLVQLGELQRAMAALDGAILHMQGPPVVATVTLNVGALATQVTPADCTIRRQTLERARFALADQLASGEPFSTAVYYFIFGKLP